MLGNLGRKRLSENFEKFVMSLVEGNEACSSFKINRVKLDNMFYDIVGMSCDDVLTCLKGYNHLIEH